MNDAMMNHAAGLLELTAQEVGSVAGGDVGADPTWSRVISQIVLPQIGAEPPPPTR